jgi:uncharacterized protein
MISASKLRSVLLVCFVLSAALMLARAPVRAADPEFPQLTGRVVDNAGLLNTEDIARITADLEALETKSTDQLVVVTLKSLQGFEIEEFGYKLGRHWGIGQKNKDNGVLLIVAPNERKVRIEVGRRLEPLLTDAISRIIIENGILPRFRDRDFPGGIKAGVSDIIAVLTGNAEDVKMRSMAKPRQDGFEDKIIAIVILLIWTLIIFAVVWSIVRAMRPGASSSSGKSGPGGWSSGSGGSSGGGWSSGGGGFSGGGGGFGGGGSSGGW